MLSFPNINAGEISSLQHQLATERVVWDQTAYILFAAVLGDTHTAHIWCAHCRKKLEFTIRREQDLSKTAVRLLKDNNWTTSPPRCNPCMIDVRERVRYFLPHQMLTMYSSKDLWTMVCAVNVYEIFKKFPPDTFAATVIADAHAHLMQQLCIAHGNKLQSPEGIIHEMLPPEQLDYVWKAMRFYDKMFDDLPDNMKP